MAEQPLLTLVHPGTCEVRHLRAGFRVGPRATEATLEEYVSDARYQVSFAAPPKVKVVGEAGGGPRALEVRVDELLMAGFVRPEVPLHQLLAEHDPWKSWRSAATSEFPLVALWRGLATEQALRSAGEVRVTEVRDEAVVLATASGEVVCERPTAPAELSRAPSFAMPLLTRHFGLTAPRFAFSFPTEDEPFLSFDDREVELAEGRPVLIDATQGTQTVLPATSEALMGLIIAGLRAG